MTKWRTWIWTAHILQVKQISNFTQHPLTISPGPMSKLRWWKKVREKESINDWLFHSWSQKMVLGMKQRKMKPQWIFPIAFAYYFSALKSSNHLTAFIIFTIFHFFSSKPLELRTNHLILFQLSTEVFTWEGDQEAHVFRTLRERGPRKKREK